MNIDENKLSPMMKHYKKIKSKYNDAIILYRLGDFYEMFFDDAVQSSSILDITLTGRDCGLSERAPMCGVPYHSVGSYIQKLIEAGLKVAICEQISDTSAKGMVERDVIRVITSGTVIEDNLLNNKSNNYIASLFINKNSYSISWADVSTGEFYAMENPIDRSIIYDTLSTINPSEIICNDYAREFMQDMPYYNNKRQVKYSTFYDWAFTHTNSKKAILSNFKIAALSVFDLEDRINATISAGALINYLMETQMRALLHIKKIVLVNNNDFMLLDANTRRHLELTNTISDNNYYGSLLWAIDYTTTSMGARLLKRWVEQPLLSDKLINTRLDLIECIINKNLAYEIKSKLKSVRDLERLMTKVIYNTINPRDLISILETLMCVPELILTIKNANNKDFTAYSNGLKTFPHIINLLSQSIVDNPPASIKDGGFIKKGYNDELDGYLDAKTNGKTYLANLESVEREKTGIKNLKVGYNKVFGYYIEVSNLNKDKVPLSYIRKQTLANQERYITPELKEIEDLLYNAESRAINLELEIYDNIKNVLVENLNGIYDLASTLAKIDAINSLSIAALENNYIKPIINKRVKSINIKEGRHTVIEKIISRNKFIPNDLYLNDDDCRAIVLTGPNMSGKSTYMRQTALITLMAHIGSYVPASYAEISLVDRIFTRIGASDDLINNQSTFMVEMLEVAHILHCATSSSLLILDEIGRGTSTCDGLSIAWALLENVARDIKCKTIFATHFHEINELEGKIHGIKNFKVLVNELNNSIVFLHKISRGGANKSFGIEVAELAGVPLNVTERARDIASTIINNNKNIDFNTILDNLKGGAKKHSQLNLFESDTKLKKTLKDINLNSITPVESMVILSDLIKMSKE